MEFAIFAIGFLSICVPLIVVSHRLFRREMDEIEAYKKILLKEKEKNHI